MKEYRPIVIRLRGYPDIRIKSASAGAYHTCLLAENGLVFSTGLNDEGQLGLDNKGNNVSWPEVIESIKDETIKHICCSRYSSALNHRGEFFAWGHFNGKDITSPMKPDCT